MRPLLPFTVALSLGFASAQHQSQDIPALPMSTTTTTPEVVPVVPVNTVPDVAAPSAKAITDVPSNHWAYEAIKLLISKGIILGYPDGTFRGNQMITRNEMAVMFARLLETNTLQPLMAAAAAVPTVVVSAPAVEAAPEPAAAPADPAVVDAPVATSIPTLSQADVDLISNAIKDLSGEIMTVNVRLKDALSDIDNIKSRLGVTEQTLQKVIEVSATHAEVQGAVQAVAVQNADALSTLQATVTTSLSSKSDTTVTAQLDTRVSALELSERQQAQAAADKAAADQAAADKAAADKAAEQTVFITPGQQSEATFTPQSSPGTSIGAGVSKILGGEGVTLHVVAERRNVIGGLNLRAGASYNATAKSYEVEGSVTKSFATGGLFEPYIGAGVGVMFSPGVTDSAETARDVFGSAIAGVDYRFTDTLGLYVETQGRYALSHGGTASGPSGMQLKIGIGAKLLF